MNNFGRGKKLIDEAKDCYLDLSEAYKRKSWNLVIRRAQEVVELCLKGILKMMGIEYPKIHDVGELFARVVRGKIIDIEEEKIKKIKETSANLSRERSRAFYMERDFNKSEAEKAKEDAEKILNWTKRLAIKISNKD